MFIPVQGIESLTTATVTGVRAALIDSNNVVQNIIVWDLYGGHSTPDGLTAIVIEDIHTPVSVGWVWDGSTFTNPNPPEVHIALEPTTTDLQSQIDILQQAIAKLIEQSK